MGDSCIIIDDTSEMDELKSYIDNVLTKDFDIQKAINRGLQKFTNDLEKEKLYNKEIDDLFDSSKREIYLMKKELNKYIYPTMEISDEDDDVVLIDDNLQSLKQNNREIRCGMKVYARKPNNIWYKGTIAEIQNQELDITERRYVVEMFVTKNRIMVTAKELASMESDGIKLQVGSRVISNYNELHNSPLFAGIVAESPIPLNKNRYLIFFDDGYAQYSEFYEVYKVLHQSMNVWEDINTETRVFIKEYLEEFPNRAMVRLKVRDIVFTEYNGKWLQTKVKEVDASLVQMYFIQLKQYEWIYRGSNRHELLYIELAKADAASKTQGKTRRLRNFARRSKMGPCVVYTRCEDSTLNNEEIETINLDSDPEDSSIIPNPLNKQHQPTARKSTNSMSKMLNKNKTNSSNELSSAQKNKSGIENQGQLVIINPSIPCSFKKPVYNKKKKHACTPNCITDHQGDLTVFRTFNPLLIPRFFGWDRPISNKFNRTIITYVAPCGKTMRSIDDIDNSLLQTDSKLTIDLFTFDNNLNINQEFDAIPCSRTGKDYSKGCEIIPIPWVNQIDFMEPNYIQYSNKRIAGKGVDINVNPEYLAGCSCTDNCRDRLKCQCIKVTVESTRSIPDSYDALAGYKYRRLKRQITTGIYECNQNCSCDERCHNRVVQHGIQRRLQLFKTHKKGWGLRCLDDIPAGGFVCDYSGLILTDDMANEEGKIYGDEYLAELDHIEIVEKCKEGYESDIPEDLKADFLDDVEKENNLLFELEINKLDKLANEVTKKKKKRGRKPQIELDKIKEKLTKKSEKNSNEISKELPIEVIQDEPITPNPITINESKDVQFNDKNDDIITSDVSKKILEECSRENSEDDDDDLLIEIDDDVDYSEFIENYNINKDECISDKGSNSKNNINNTDDKQDLLDGQNKVIFSSGDYCERKEGSIMSNEKEEERENKNIDTLMEEKLEKKLIDSLVLEDKNTDSNPVDLLIENKVECKEGESSGDKLDLQQKDHSNDEALLSLNKNLSKHSINSLNKSNDEEIFAENSSEVLVVQPLVGSSKMTARKSSHKQLKISKLQPNNLKESSKQVSLFSEIESSNDFNHGFDELLTIGRRLRSHTLTVKNVLDPPRSQKKNKGNSGTLVENDKSTKYVSLRNLYGEDEMYIIDARVVGNIGRFFNHSCAPNIFVQNVFVDTHDLRFPWVAFFASKLIRAGVELTWDYNYEVGSVAGKVLHCHCGSVDCKGRLL